MLLLIYLFTSYITHQVIVIVFVIVFVFDFVYNPEFSQF